MLVRIPHRRCVIETPASSGATVDPVSALKAAHQKARIQAGAIFASLVVLVIVVEVLRRRTDLPDVPAKGSEVLRIVFYAVAVSMVFFVNLVHAFMLRTARVDEIGRIAARLAVVTVVMNAMSEIPVILGFVLFVLFGYYTDFYILGFVSLYLLVRHFPYYRQWEKFARNRMGLKWPAGPVDG
jgi:hypothetical protein